jgi:hypothetical protein
LTEHELADRPLIPAPGDGVVARHGTAVFVGLGGGDDDVLDKLLDACRRAGSAAAPGRQLARTIAGILVQEQPESVPAFCAFAPTDTGLAAIVHGEAELFVEGGNGEVLVAGRDAATWVDRVIPGPIGRVEARPPGATLPEPRRRFALHGGVVPGGGATLLPGEGDAGSASPGIAAAAGAAGRSAGVAGAAAGAVAAGAAAAVGAAAGAAAEQAARRRAEEESRQQAAYEQEAARQRAGDEEAARQRAAEDDAARRRAEEEEAARQEQAAAAEAARQQAAAEEAARQQQAAAEEAARQQAAAEEAARQQAAEEAARQQAAEEAARQQAAEEAARQQAAAEQAARQQAAAEEAARQRAAEEAARQQAAAEEEARRRIEEQSSQVPPVGAQGAVAGAAQASAGFQSVLLADDDDEPAESRSPLPLAGQAVAQGNEPPDDLPDDMPPQVEVDGITCARGHFNNPNSLYCSVCGLSMVQQTSYLVKGVRPPLGVFVFDDGTTFTVDSDYVIGREPEGDPRVVGGEARPMAIPDPERAISRVHAEIYLKGWDVVVRDRGSANGTYILPPGGTEWLRLPSDTTASVPTGARVLVGRRHFIFDSHHVA